MPRLKRNKKSAHRCEPCTLAVVRRSQKISFCPTADPPSQGHGTARISQLEMVTTFTYKSSLVRIDAHNFELSW